MPDILRASISREPLKVEAFSRSLRVPFVPASEWMSALSQDDFITSVFPGMLGDKDFEWVANRMADGAIDYTDLKKPAFDLVRQASGFRWWEALKLVGMTDSDPLVMGLLTLSGVDPDAVPFGRWCAALYSLNVKDLDDKERNKWLARFNAPPPIAEALEEAEDGLSFEGMVRGFQGMPGARIG